MNRQIRTMKVSELINSLTRFKKTFGDYNIYMSMDEEGNGYGTLDPQMSLKVNDLDQALILYPFEERLDDEEVFPKQTAQIIAELKQEGVIK